MEVQSEYLGGGYLSQAKSGARHLIAGPEGVFYMVGVSCKYVVIPIRFLNGRCKVTNAWWKVRVSLTLTHMHVQTDRQTYKMFG